jgi:nucleotide-binding universal stress UspA family protein
MNILLAADGSRFTKKALAFLLANNKQWLEPARGEPAALHVLNVQGPVPPRVRSAVGLDIVNHYHDEEAMKVLKPIRKFLDQHGIAYTSEWLVGQPGEEIVKAAKKRKAQLIVMGTHGHGALGRLLMGSVAQRVVTDSSAPVLLVK